MEPAKTKRGQYLSGQSTRTKILESAVKIIGSSGYHGLALRALASKSEVAHATVVYHFADKETLLREVILYWENALGLVNCSPDEYSQGVKLEGINFDTYEDLLLKLMYLAKRPDISDLLSLSSTLISEGSDPEYPAHNYIKRRHEMLFPHLVAVLRKSRSNDEIRYSSSTTAVAETLVTLWYGTALASKYLQDPAEVANLMSNFLAACICQTGFPPEKLLQFSDEVPTNLEDIYMQILHYVKNCGMAQYLKAPEESSCS
ncbi:MAG: TetR/AcrR family transcriptional regulator [Actinomycetaceae bacterium]|nr:TetR/AcrR family transcriptional regulator [Actinomycetaceae bacterium]